jgi:membrane protein DedA with SNARE-associated domain
MFDLMQILQNGLLHVSAAALFFIFLFGTFVSEDAACLLAGTAVAGGRMSFAAALIACFLGIFAGDILLYAAGRAFGKRVFDNQIVRKFLSDSSVGKASAWLEKNGATAVFTTRFVSGIRLPTYLLAGALRTNFAKFALYFLLASAIWTPILVGSTAFTQTFLFSKNSIIGLVIVGVALRLILKYSSRKNRRLFIGRLKRIWNWEFWPLQIFYAPVVLYVFILAIKHGGLMVFTAANPAIPASGFKGESKDEIYRGLSSSDAASEHMLCYTLLKKDSLVDEKLRQAWQFTGENDLTYPLVFKPDTGERGKGINIVRSPDVLEAILAPDADMILQEFAAGDEASIFYCRYPNEKHGHILSITEKRFPVLIGDGISTLEELILEDARAVCLAEKYFEQNRERLERVPEKGEAVKLIDIGTHSRGAIFLDGEWMKTKILEEKIDEICRSFAGFYFGRFDIRTPSFGDLMRGEKFKIIELNGVTSESTNIYDPRYSLIDAYRILFKQWRMAFEIGAANCKLGFDQTRPWDLVKLVFGVKIEEERQLYRDEPGRTGRVAVEGRR